MSLDVCVWWLLSRSGLKEDFKLRYRRFQEARGDHILTGFGSWGDVSLVEGRWCCTRVICCRLDQVSDEMWEIKWQNLVWGEDTHQKQWWSNSLSTMLKSGCDAVMPLNCPVYRNLIKFESSLYINLIWLASQQCNKWSVFEFRGDTSELSYQFGW